MQKPTKPWTPVQLEHQVISESPRKVIYRFGDEPEKIYTTMEHAMRVRSLPQEVPPLSLYDKYQLWSEQKLRPQPDMANEIAIKNKTIDALRLQIRELERILTEMEQAIQDRSAPQEAPPLSQHDTANEIEDKDRYISSLKRVIWELTENNLKAAGAQKRILQYSLFTKAVVKALGLPATNHKLTDLTNRIENLVGWKKEALADLKAWDLVAGYLRESPDLTIGDNLSEKCLEFLRERDALIRERDRRDKWDLFLKSVSK